MIHYPMNVGRVKTQRTTVGKRARESGYQRCALSSTQFLVNQCYAEARASRKWEGAMTLEVRDELWEAMKEILRSSSRVVMLINVARCC
jgi:hypothetical protein